MMKETTMDSLDRLERLLENYQDLVERRNKEIDKLEKQLYHLKPFRDLVYHIASKRYENVDDYIRLAKQAIADYESVLK